jgi:hypothetical protein
MRIQLAGGSVKRLVNVWRDSKPLPGEKVPNRIAVEACGFQWGPKTVAENPLIKTPKFQQYLLDDSPAADRLLYALPSGPIKPSMRGNSWRVDVDRIMRR